MAAKKKEKKAPRTRAPAVSGSIAERNAHIEHIIAEAEKHYGPGRVMRAQDTNASYLLRRPTGIISIDIAMAGGWPASAPAVLVGPDGAGKDYLLWRTAAETQRLYGEEFCMAVYFTEFKPDKLYMKDYCGLQIALSDKELLELDMARQTVGYAGLTSDEIDHYKHQIGEFIPILGVSADNGFDMLRAFIERNICQIVAVNSIGFMQTEAKEKVEAFEEFAQQRNEAALLSKAMPKFAMDLNAGAIDGGANETSIILVNQVRSKDSGGAKMPGRIPQEKDGYKTAANSWALKHGKAIELFLHNGPKIVDDEDKTFVLGRKKQWELTKGKLGTHEGIKGEFSYFHEEGADIAGDLLNTARSLGIIPGGGWIKYTDSRFGFTVQGEDKAISLLNRSPELMDHLRQACFQAAGVVYRHR